MTSNLRFGQADTATVMRTLAAQDVDVLLLEEVTPKALQSLRAAGLAKLLPHERGAPVVTAAGTMVLSRHALTSPRPFDLGNVGLEVRVAAPDPFPPRVPSIAFECPGRQRLPAPGSPGHRPPRCRRAGRLGVAAHVADPIPQELVATVDRDRPRAE